MRNACCLLMSLPFFTGAKFSAEQSLINELLKGYNKDAHPEPQQINKTAYKVVFGLELVQLVNVVRKSIYI